MEGIEIARSPCSELKNGPKSADRDTGSVDNFQKFFYELFEKNGILNDLRAYLRRHIVDVLKKSNGGDTPMCQKHFAQRLELKAQTLNILVAEYLIQSDLNYTLSVFISEIPLANMVFEFAGSLMKGDGIANLRFKDKDVWSIIQHLGIKCDSKLISKILEMYKNEKQSLLYCIIKSLQIAAVETPCMEPATSSDEALSARSSETVSDSSKKKLGKRSRQHGALCKACMLLKDKYNKRRDMEKTKQSSPMSTKINSLMEKISKIEGNLVNEMFDQLKSVYEAEIEMMRSKQERRVQQALKEHALTLQQQRQELEDAYKAREEDLERGVRAKKKFLWGLARTLRTQHDQLARAMIAVKYHTQRLKAQEGNLMAQVSEVEHLMKTNSQDVSVNISSELVDLQRQLDLVKKERETVNREKAELEHLRQEISSQHADIDIDEIEAVSDTAWSNYDKLKTELTMLRKIIDTPSDTKLVSEQTPAMEVNRSGTVRSTAVLNNDKEIKVAREEDRLKNNQLINDFKKQKNVNFNMENTEEMAAERHCPVEQPHRPNDDAVEHLAHENERLRELARLQQQQVAQLNERMAQLEAKLNEAGATPSRSIPPTPAQPDTQAGMPSVNNSGVEPPSSLAANGWRCCGGGEETALLKLQPRVFIPGDNVPFIGILHDRHEPKRLMNQWRCGRRTSPVRGRRPSPSPPPPPITTAHDDGNTQDVQGYQHDNIDIKINDNQPPSKQNADSDSPKQPTNNEVLHVSPTHPQGGLQIRAKSPKSVLREAKEKLRTTPTQQTTEISFQVKSPTTVLREAKLRLRKLEIEAEAVEKSYMDYRKRQNELRSEQDNNMPVKEEAVVTKDVDGGVPKNLNWDISENPNSVKGEIKSFLQEHRRKIHSSDTQFPNNTATSKTKPIPEAFSPFNAKSKGTTENYLEAPMADFQQFYRTFNRPKSAEDGRNKRKLTYKSPPLSPPPNDSPQRLAQPSIGDTNEIKQLEAKTEALNKEKDSKKFEMEILKQNITHMYPFDTENKEEKTAQDGDSEASLPLVEQENATNLVTVEVENINDTNELKIDAEPKEVVVVVKSSPKETIEVEKSKKLRGNMTILISPKGPSDRALSRSASPEQAANLTKSDVLEAIYQANPTKVISTDAVDDAGDAGDAGDQSEGEYAANLDDYPDDFSADVDNYDSHEGDPVSHDDTAWDDSHTYP